MCMIAIVTGCQKPSTVVTLSDAPLTLSDKAIVLKPEEPLLRTNRSLSIRIQMKETWSAEPPWKNIRMQDGTFVTIKAVLFSDKGIMYHPIIIGAGNGLDIRFNDSVPKDAKIVKILLTSTYPLTALNITWFDWNPK